MLFRHKPKIAVVTGTVGKTSTKDALYSVFSAFSYARKSDKGFNSDIGVPLVILDLDTQWSNAYGWLKNIILGLAGVVLPTRYPKWLILEVGMDEPGGVRDIARWLKPDIVVATRFADVPVHVEFFDSPEDVIKEEQSIAYSLKEGGVLIVNNDDEHAVALRKELGCKSISFGMDEKAGVSASHLETLYAEAGEYKKPTGIRFRAEYEEMSGPVSIEGVLGVQHVYPALAALAAGVSQGFNMVKMSQAFNERHTTPPGRMKIIDGKNNSVIIDDTYNSSPVAAESALDVLCGLELSGRKVAILGDMKELGRFTKREHQRIGEKAGECADLVVFVGEHTAHFAEGAFKSKLKKENIYEFDNALQVAQFMGERLKEDDVVLIKGSQSIRLEKVAKAIMRNPEKRHELLVRQEEEWTKR